MGRDAAKHSPKGSEILEIKITTTNGTSPLIINNFMSQM